MSNQLLLIIFKIFILKLIFINNTAIEQKLIIDLKKPLSLISQKTKSGIVGEKQENIINSNGHFGKEQGFLNVLTIEHGATMKKRNSYNDENDGNSKHSYNSIEKRLDRLEANQQHLRRAALADWPSFSVDKRVRIFAHPRSGWTDAQRECAEHAGTLLEIDSESENERINEMLTNSGSDRPHDLYWIGVQIMLQFSNGSSIIGNYSNFDEQKYFASENSQNLQQSKGLMMKRCAAISASQTTKIEGGRWLSLECSEKHGFICQL
uniref:C-type lectin domain-containing protein n=1 Tax=Meloidogyne hapla TaxID=6305 RepID=A0A1I8BAB8_MELHA